MKKTRSPDALAERFARGLAARISRRSLLGWIGMSMTGALSVPLLPVDRSGSARAAEAKTESESSASCEYWKYCAIDGFLCECCGGTSSSCPPGTTASAITWIGTCLNPHDQRNYIVSYNDCCGKTSCGRCFCDRNEGEKPLYRLARNNDFNWCAANDNQNYHCSVSVVLGMANP